MQDRGKKKKKKKKPRRGDVLESCAEEMNIQIEYIHSLFSCFLEKRTRPILWHLDNNRSMGERIINLSSNILFQSVSVQKVVLEISQLGNNKNKFHRLSCKEAHQHGRYLEPTW